MFGQMTATGIARSCLRLTAKHGPWFAGGSLGSPDRARSTATDEQHATGSGGVPVRRRGGEVSASGYPNVTESPEGQVILTAGPARSRPGGRRKTPR